MYNLAAGTAHQEVFYYLRAIHKIGYTITPLLEQVKKINKNSVIFLPGHSYDTRLELKSIKIRDKIYVNRQKHKADFMGYMDRLLT